MTDNNIKILEEIGVNLDEVMERFMGNEKLYITCLGKFCADNNYNLLMNAYLSKDVSQAFSAAHALKGMAANMGFESLFKPVSEVTEVFRAGSIDVSEAKIAEIKEIYKFIVSKIEQIDKQ